MLSPQIFRPSTVIQLPGGKYRDRRDSSQPNFDRYIKPISIGGGQIMPTTQGCHKQLLNRSTRPVNISVQYILHRTIKQFPRKL